MLKIVFGLVREHISGRLIFVGCAQRTRYSVPAADFVLF